MDLQEFVKMSVVQICKGIQDANDELAESTAMVNPLNIIVNTESSQGYARTISARPERKDSRVVDKIQFDVAVTTEAGEQGKAGAKLSIASVGFGAEGKIESSNKSESRIKFSIPMVFPGFENAS